MALENELDAITAGERALADQTAEHARGVAGAIAEFYAELDESDLPRDMVEELTREFGLNLIRKMTYQGLTFYLDDEGHVPGDVEKAALTEFGKEPPAFVGGPGYGWAKVTLGRGSPQYAHSSLAVVEGSVKEREDAD